MLYKQLLKILLLASSIDIPIPVNFPSRLNSPFGLDTFELFRYYNPGPFDPKAKYHYFNIHFIKYSICIDMDGSNKQCFRFI